MTPTEFLVGCIVRGAFAEPGALSCLTCTADHENMRHVVVGSLRIGAILRENIEARTLQAEAPSPCCERCTRGVLAALLRVHGHPGQQAHCPCAAFTLGGMHLRPVHLACFGVGYALARSAPPRLCDLCRAVDVATVRAMGN